MDTDTFNIPDFLILQLAFISERLAPEEKARVDWWKQRIQSLVEQEPGRSPRSQHLNKTPQLEGVFRQ